LNKYRESVVVIRELCFYVILLTKFRNCSKLVHPTSAFATILQQSTNITRTRNINN